MYTKTLYRPVRIGKLQLKGNLFLAPAAGYSDVTFRSVAVEWGADFTYTEMVSSEAMVRDSQKTENLFKRAPNEQAYAVQIFGSNPNHMAETAKKILEKASPSCIDINAGCPMPKITKTGAGSALMRNPQNLYTVTKAVRDAVDTVNISVPVTVKIRSGWNTEHLTWKDAAQAAVDAGAAAITIHPRTASQCYGGKADWTILAQLAQMLHPQGISVFGSGDLFTPEDAKAMLEQTDCDAVMFARGAMGNPFIFKRTKELLLHGSYADISFERKLKTGWDELLILTQELGEERACKEMRKRFAAYTKGLEGGAELRKDFVKASTIEEYKSILSMAL
ncbi:tRNA dihydrouridine synthase DusB [Treponema phagedenis]|uniref:tRNA-dihydrouridine synthase n=1 Tax=Treponema phagedenis TaxID=162 RepID=A0A0B7GQP5_TREPH|nr:tRNA dihydrouridine synthase DusB [Treponema phagedenis]EFW39326.1 TIM-barrel protein, nifR3 family [Treponema phagedenis F0421]NVP24618.1 tRNA dihydrouridine synthase DusB [Treponema phagedenis]QEK00595.1 tRNA dihydrouridine synthase DusB [Treponema phagedenis]QEK05605.1 tRNA dihydrouridine synthase DusB [Treponema phagedenis]QKS91921.1 tRNA dihydrouridine synthase DusB [Treponema phagedenis]